MTKKTVKTLYNLFNMLIEVQFMVSIIFAKISKLVFRSYTIISFSFILTLSILSPSVISLLNKEFHIVIEDFNDDEREDNEEKEIEEIDTEENEDEKEESFFLPLINSFFYNTNTTLNSIHFIEGVSIYSLEIQLPPPEHNI